VVCLIQVNGKDFKFPFSRAAAGVKKSQNSERYRKQDAVHESDVRTKDLEENKSFNERRRK
jgi:hypothetical protein